MGSYQGGLQKGELYKGSRDAFGHHSSHTTSKSYSCHQNWFQLRGFAAHIRETALLPKMLGGDFPWFIALQGDITRGRYASDGYRLDEAPWEASSRIPLSTVAFESEHRWYRPHVQCHIRGGASLPRSPHPSACFRLTTKHLIPFPQGTSKGRSRVFCCFSSPRPPQACPPSLPFTITARHEHPQPVKSQHFRPPAARNNVHQHSKPFPG